jgi:hypothetical protein
MSTNSRAHRHGESGQALAMVVLAFVALLGMTGIIIDGGNAWAQQRITQNASDAVAEAGAVVLVQRMGGTTKTDADVLAAVNAAGTNNQLGSAPEAFYTNVNGELLTSGGAITSNENAAAQVGGGSIPSGAAGVFARGSRPFQSYIARIVGATTFTANAEATAVAGVLTGICPASAGCGVLPVTFPVVVSTCDNTNGLVPGSAPWPLVSPANANSTNMAIVPLCQNGPGAVGWLDLGGGNLADQINTPTNASFDVPTWLQTQSGNMNNVETEFNAYIGDEVLLPLFDGTCKVQPSGTLLGDCPAGQEGVGNNTYYHVPKFTGFLLDRAYISGANHPECNSSPGQPFVGGNGSTGCLKGWFIRYVTEGPVGGGNVGSTDPAALGVQLIH